MKNKKIDILKIAHKRFSALEAIIPSYFRANKFCNGVMAFCRGVADSSWIWAANDDELFSANPDDFENFSGAANESDGWFLIPYGDYAHRVGTQRFDVAAANEILSRFNSRWGRLKRSFGFGTAVPVYRGHPDVGPNGSEGTSSIHIDQTQYGAVEDMAVRQNGLALKIKLNAAAEKLPKGLEISPFWKMRTIDKTARIHRPAFLRSIGLTYNPNISGLGAANSAMEDSSLTQTKEINMLKKILELLKFSTDEIENLSGNETEAAAALDKTITELYQKIGVLEDAKTVAEGELAKLRLERTEAEEKLNAAANSRDVLVGRIIDGAIAKGVITEADRAAETQALCGAEDMVAAANELEARPPKVETKSETEDIKTADSKAAAKSQFSELVKKYKSEGASHSDSWTRAKNEQPDIYKLAFES